MNDDVTPDAGVRLAKLIASRGLSSRREAERWIEEGRVTVNGTCVRGPTMVDPDADAIRVEGRALPPEPEKVYLLVYKPKGYITGRDDVHGRKSVLDLVDGIGARLEPVGRLDLDTEGALILTNDGDLAHGLTHPSRRVPKRYLAKVWRTPSEGKLTMIREGKVQLEDGRLGPSRCRVVDATDSENAWVEITVTEGRNRVVRRVFQQLHHPVSKLRRESFGTISIRGMERGDVRRLTRAEVIRLQDLASGTQPQRAGKVRSRKGFAKAKPKGRVQARRRKAAKSRNRP